MRSSGWLLAIRRRIFGAILSPGAPSHSASFDHCLLAPAPFTASASQDPARIPCWSEEGNPEEWNPERSLLPLQDHIHPFQAVSTRASGPYLGGNTTRRGPSLAGYQVLWKGW